MPPLRIEIQPSRLALLLVSLVLLLTIVSVNATTLKVSEKLLVWSVCILFSSISLYQLGWLGNGLPKVLRFDGGKNWYLEYVASRSFNITEFKLVYVSRSVCFFKIKVVQRRRLLPLILFADSCDPSSLRRLRVLMRHGRENWTALK